MDYCTEEFLRCDNGEWYDDDVSNHSVIHETCNLCGDMYNDLITCNGNEVCKKKECVLCMDKCFLCKGYLCSECKAYNADSIHNCHLSCHIKWKERQRDVACALGIRGDGNQHTGRAPQSPFWKMPPEIVLKIYKEFYLLGL